MTNGTVRELWDEYRISKQFESVTGAMREACGVSDGTEECLRPEVKIRTERKTSERRGKSIWIEMVSVPRWFLYEIGYNREG